MSSALDNFNKIVTEERAFAHAHPHQALKRQQDQNLRQKKAQMAMRWPKGQELKKLITHFKSKGM